MGNACDAIPICRKPDSLANIGAELGRALDHVMRLKNELAVIGALMPDKEMLRLFHELNPLRRGDIRRSL
jgi:hypothetical protein